MKRSLFEQNGARLNFLSLLSAVLLMLGATIGRAQSPQAGALALPGHIPAAVAGAQAVSRLDATRGLSLALILPLHNQGELENLIRGQSDPESADYGHFLTPEEFADRFSPTQDEYDRAIAYARSLGLNVTATYSNRTVLDVSGPAGQVERAFGTHLLVYHSHADGRYFYAPDAEPLISPALGGIISGIVGLDNAAQWHPHNVRLIVADPFVYPLRGGNVRPLETGSGPGGGLTPSDIKAAYNLSGVAQNGGGQTLGLFELDGYTASDIATYESYFGLPSVTLQNVLVDSATGVAGGDADEVTLDIELQIALAPAASRVVVYEGPKSSTGVVDTYNKIASDNIAKEVSTSWGEAENSAPASVRSSENAAFQQMAAQGQSIFAAAGDSGAYDNGSILSVDDPASQPYMVGVGGTSLTTSGASGPYGSEETWANPNDTRRSAHGAGGGGGISTVWGIPSYQSGVVSAASKGSTSARNVPDVSLDADPNTGYSIYYSDPHYGAKFYVYGGTSCATPLWSAFTALVNQQRVTNGNALLGFANPPIYMLAKGSRYASDFHDIADGSTNLYYPAIPDYDDATGWGSFIGANLLADLSGPLITQFSPTHGPVGTAVTLFGNGFIGATNMSIGGVAASFTVNSDTQVTATVPAGAATGPIVILGPGGRSTTGINFVIPTHVITGFSPTSGWPGTVVTLTGIGFMGATNMSIAGAPARFVVNSDTQVTATVPAGATTGPIIILGPNGRSTTGTNFVVPEPVVFYFAPTSGLPGTVVTLTGVGFTGATNMSIAGAPARFVVNSDTQVTATVPVGAATGPIVILGPNGRSVPGVNFVVPVPIITGFSPTSGPIGTTVTLTGTGFTGVTNLAIAGAACSFVVNSDTQIKATVAAGATTGPVLLVGPGGRSTTSINFVVPEPVVFYFAPTSGLPGTVLTLTGSGFTGATNMSIGGVAASFTVNSDSRVTATVPTGAATGPIVILGPAGSSVPGVNFVIPAPAITWFAPTSGLPGTVVTLGGSNFTGATNMSIGGVAASFTVNSDSRVTAVVPVGAVNGPIVILGPGGRSTTGINFVP